MGDVSAEPSMEDILSSIKRIIAEEGDDRPIRPRRSGAVRAMPAAPIADDDDEPEEVLEPVSYTHLTLPTICSV